MKRMLPILLIICLAIPGASSHVTAQDASHMETAKSKESSDWGLLGLVGLVGLLGLRRKERTVISSDGNQRFQE